MTSIQEKTDTMPDGSFTITILTACNSEGEPVLQVNILSGTQTQPTNIARIIKWQGLQDCVYKYIYGERCELCDMTDEMFTYIRAHYPAITKVSYSDPFVPDGTYYWETMTVSCLSFAFTGTTYFEDRFQAIAPPHSDWQTGEVSNAEMETYIAARPYFVSQDFKASLSFFGCASQFHFCLGLDRVPLEIANIESIYDRTSTIPEFVKTLDIHLRDHGVPLRDRFAYFRHWLYDLQSFPNGVCVPRRWIWDL